MVKENVRVLKVLKAKNYDELLDRPYKESTFKKEKLSIYRRLIRGSVRLLYRKVK